MLHVLSHVTKAMLLHVMCHVSSVMCHVTCVSYYVTCAICYRVLELLQKFPVS